MASAARFDRRKRWPIKPYERRDSYQQQLKQDARYWESRPQRTTLPLVHDYLAANPSTDRPRGQLSDEIALLTAQLEHAKAFKATAAPPPQQAAPTRRNAEPPTRFGSHNTQYGALYSFFPVSFSSQAFGAPVVAPAAGDAHADALLAKRGFLPGSVRIAKLPRQSRPITTAPAPAPLASTLYSVAAQARALAASNAAPPVSQAAPQHVAPSNFSVPSHLLLPTLSQSFFPTH